MNDVAIIGVGLHPFGRVEGKSAMQMGVDAIFAFLKIEDVSRDERIWVRRVIGAAKKNALYVPQSGKPLPWAGVTREMVIGAIEEKIKALETA